jgi:hypothetical protein
MEAQQDASGKHEELEKAFHEAGQDAHGKWGKGAHKAKARIEVELTENPGIIQEYTVWLTKI